MKRKLLVLIDEAMSLMTPEVAQKLLTLRHSNIHVGLGIQIPHLCRPEAFAACDFYCIFNLVDERDKRQIKHCLNLSHDQAAYLSTLPQGRAVCFLPKSQSFTSPFLIEIQRLTTNSDALEVAPADFLNELEWEDLDQTVTIPIETTASGLAEDAERFLRDCCTRKFEFSNVTARSERCGVRSNNRRSQIVKLLIAQGYVRAWNIVVGQGRPWQLLEPTDKARELLGVTSWSKGRGNLPTRCGMFLLVEKFKVLAGWNCVAEGQCVKSGKQIDLLLRDPSGKAVAVEIAGASADHEIHNLMANMEQSGDELRKHVVIALDNVVLASVKKKINALPELFTGNVEVEVLTLAHALKMEWLP